MQTRAKVALREATRRRRLTSSSCSAAHCQTSERGQSPGPREALTTIGEIDLVGCFATRRGRRIFSPLGEGPMKCLWIAVTVLVLVGCGGSSGGPPSNPGPGSDGGVGNPGDGGVAGLGFSPEPLVLGTTPGTPASAQLTLTNSGSSAVNVTALSVSGDQASSFQVAPAAALPLSVAPGGTATMTITFNGASAGPAHAILTATGQGGTLAQAHLGALAWSQEPSLQWVLDAHWIPVNTSSPDPTTRAMPTTPRLGDELGIQSFVKASSGPVTLQLIGAFGPPFVDPMMIAGWYPTGMASGETPLFTIPKAQAQVMDPQ